MRKVACAALVALLTLAGCAGAPPETAAPPTPVQKRLVPGEVVDFAFETLSGGPLSTASVRGRITVIGFVATYDSASQAEAQFLHELLRSHKPRINVGLLVLEAPDNRPLVEVFVETFRLPYPVAIADADTIAGVGPFRGLHHVPSVVVLDADGREAWRHVGLIEREPLDAALRAIEEGRMPDGGEAQPGL